MGKTSGKHGKHAAPSADDAAGLTHAEETRAIDAATPRDAGAEGGESMMAGETQVMGAISPPSNAAYAGIPDGTQVMRPTPAQPQASYNPGYYDAQAMPQLAVMAPGAMIPNDMGYGPVKRHHGLKVFLISLAIVLGILAIVYVAGAFVFQSRFYPNTVISNHDVSFKTADDVALMLDNSLADYSFTISGQGLDVTLTSDDAGLSIDGDDISETMLSHMNPWMWPFEIFKFHDETDSMVTTVRSTDLVENVKTAVDKFNTGALAPVNASVAFDPASGAYVTKPEIYGTMLDSQKVADQVAEELKDMPSRIHISQDALLLPEIVEGDPRLEETRNKANAMVSAQFDVTMAGASVGALTAEQLSSWIVIGDDGSVTLNPEPINAWANDIKARYDTIGSTRTYTRPDGKSITISGGDYGWNVDSGALAQAAQDGINAGKQDPLEVPVSQAAKARGGNGSADWGNRYIDVDLTEQHARFYDDSGSIIWESDIVSGLPTEQRATPTGVWDLNDKEKNAKLIGYTPSGEKDYETPVDRWMPFVGNGVGFHDANWQPSFGGDRYTYGGSHGCVNLPVSKAYELYDIIEIGDVIITHW